MTKMTRQRSLGLTLTKEQRRQYAHWVTVCQGFTLDKTSRAAVNQRQRMFILERVIAGQADRISAPALLECLPRDRREVLRPLLAKEVKLSAGA